MRTQSLPSLSVREAEAVFLNGPQAQRLTTFAAARLGLSHEVVRAQVRAGLVPLVVVSLSHGSVVASPTVGTLIDLVREHGTEEMKGLLPFEAAEISDENEYLSAYGRTRELVLAMCPEQPDLRIWPAMEAFSICPAPNYKNNTANPCS